MVIRNGYWAVKAPEKKRNRVGRVFSHFRLGVDLRNESPTHHNIALKVPLEKFLSPERPDEAVKSHDTVRVCDMLLLHEVGSNWEDILA